MEQLNTHGNKMTVSAKLHVDSVDSRTENTFPRVAQLFNIKAYLVV